MDVGLISIHTPAKGVTKSYFRINCSKRHFNPHSREGSDLIVRQSQIISEISIHTPAKGVTSFKVFINDKVQISIHTPAKGVTR